MQVKQDVLNVFAELTRYPFEILVDSADLEQDLGIDSVKRAEIFTALREKYHLPNPMGVAADELRTVGGVVRAIEGFVGAANANANANGNGHAVSAPQVATSVPSIAPHATHAPSIAPIASHAPSIPPHAAHAPSIAPHAISMAPATNGNGSVGAVRRNGVPKMIDGHAPASELPALSADNVERRVLSTLMSVIGETLSRVEGRSSNGSAVPSLAPELAEPARERDREFAGKIALVTGSGHGLGRTIALDLAARGATVIVNSFHSRDRGEATAEEIRAAGGDAIHIWGSVANSKQLAALFAEIEARYGGLDLFVSNASNGVIAPIDQITEEHWEKALRTNIIAFHQGSLLAAAMMKKRGGGRIVALSSPGAQRYIDHFACMGPIKAALESLALYLSVELGRHNIQVNVVSAGPVYGELLSAYPESESLIPYWESLSPDRTLGKANEISDAVQYLLSRAASKVNGAVLLVDGGASRRM